MVRRLLQAACESDEPSEDPAAVLAEAAGLRLSPVSVVARALEQSRGEFRTAILSALGEFVASAPIQSGFALLAANLRSPSEATRLGATYGLERVASPEVVIWLRKAAEVEPAAYIGYLQRRIADAIEGYGFDSAVRADGQES